MRNFCRVYEPGDDENDEVEDLLNDAAFGDVPDETEEDD